MAELFENVFNAQSIYETLFFNVKSVLKYQSIGELEKNDEALFKRWTYISRFKLSGKYSETTKAQTVYERHAPYYPEFTKILAITYATLYNENGTLKRYLKKIVNEDEYIVLSTFMDELYHLSTEGAQSSPNFFPILCGHNIISRDIPHLLKKIVLYRKELNRGVPLILKKALNSKPWESRVIDTVNVWKFNGYDNIPLMLISDYLDLKKTVDLLPLEELSKVYWEAVDTDKEKALEYVSLQSATQTNLVIQIINNLRQM